MAVYITEAGDVADLIVWRLTGRGAGPAEQLLELNPGLADLGAVLPAGVAIDLPPEPASERRAPVRLWD